MSVPSNVNLLLCLKDRNEVALSIPFAQCTTFAITPLKWLRFLGFVIYGRQGYLSTSTSGPELDYTAQIEARSYYFRSDARPCFADVDAMDNRTSTASGGSNGMGNFRKKLIMRDATCVLTGDFIEYCKACHIIPHTKGDDYMTNLFNHRHETYGLVDALDDINDARNGILLHSSFHHALYHGHIAFLKTPNFALTVEDIPYTQQSDAGSPASRLTLQHIQPSRLGIVIPHLAPHNSDARQPEDISQWPLAIIVDLFYAAAVLKAWGPATFIDFVSASSKDSYYDYGDDVEEDDSEEGGGASGGLTPQVSRQPTTRYGTRSANKACTVDPADQPTRTLEDMLDVVLALWRQAVRGGERWLPDSDAADVANNENKIQTWLQSMEESTS